jgi:hypothetical protein
MIITKNNPSSSIPRGNDVLKRQVFRFVCHLSNKKWLATGSQLSRNNNRWNGATKLIFYSPHMILHTVQR